MLISLTTTEKNRSTHALTYLFNQNRITDFIEKGEYAKGSVVITSYANLVSGTDDVVTIAGVAFTAQTGAATPGQATFRAATSNSATAISLTTQINAYNLAGAPTLANVTATTSGSSVLLQADAYGTTANSYGIVYTDNDTNVGATVSGATMSGGVASTVEFYYEERAGDRRSKSDQYASAMTYATLRAYVNGDSIPGVRIELTATERNGVSYAETINISADDIVKVTDSDGSSSYVDVARGTFSLDRYLVSHTLAAILALENAVILRGVAESGVTATEYGDGTYHKTVLTLDDKSFTVAGAALGMGYKIWTAPEGYIHVDDVLADLTISSDTATDTPDYGLGTVIAEGAVSLLSGTSTFEDIFTGGVAATAITKTGSSTQRRDEAEADVQPYDGTSTAMPVFFNFADSWGVSDDFTVSGTITLWWKHLGDI